MLRRIRASDKTALLPVVVLTTSKEHQDISEALSPRGEQLHSQTGRFRAFIHAVGQLGLYWLSLNEPVEPNGGG